MLLANITVVIHEQYLDYSSLLLSCVVMPLWCQCSKTRDFLPYIFVESAL